jgi:dTDP-4-dehydrorhamnose reductase
LTKVRDLIKGATFRAARGFDALKPELSVILPTYRRGDSGYFRRACESLLAQKFENFELIIIDDASVDSTASIIDGLMARDPRVAVIRHAVNIGLAAVSEAEGFLAARGRKILCAFDDNVFDPDGIAALMEDQRKHPDHLVSFGVGKVWHSDDWFEEYGFDDFDYEAIKTRNVIANSSVVFDRSVVEKVGYYDPHIALMRVWDWDLWRRMATAGIEFHRVSADVVSEYGVSLPDSLGNTVKYDSGVMCEYMEFDRNLRLLPSEILDYDVDTVYPANSLDFAARLKSMVDGRFKGRFRLSETSKDPFRKVLVVGARGVLGREFRTLLGDRRGLFAGREDIDITDQASIDEYIGGKSISAIINCAANRDTEKIESDPDTYRKINVEGPVLLMRSASRLGVPLVAFSSDYVFDGSSNVPYTESDKTRALFAYGRQKVEMEERLLSMDGTCVVIRSAWFMHPFDEGFIRKIIRQAVESQEISVVYDQTGSPTSARDLAAHVLDILGRVRPGTRGVYHLTNEGVATWFDIASEVVSRLKIPCRVRPVLSSQYAARVVRPHYSVLDKSKVKAEFGVSIRHWRDAIGYVIDPRNSMPLGDEKYIVVFSVIYDASISLVFGSLSPELRKKIVFVDQVMFDADPDFYGRVVARANAVIIARVINDPYARPAMICAALGVPYYFYTDDNMFELGIQRLDERSIGLIRGASGVITTSANLEEWFRARGMGRRFMSANAAYSAAQRASIPPVGEKFSNPPHINMLYASNHRVDGLVGMFGVFRNLVKDYRLKFYFFLRTHDAQPEYLEEFRRMCRNVGIELEILVVQFVCNWLPHERFINQIRGLGIHFYVVPGSENKLFQINHMNKTLNPLLNAWLSSSIPVFPDIEPYSELKRHAGVKHCVCDSDGKAEAMMRRVLSDKAFASEVLDGMERFSLEHFSPDANAGIVSDILAAHASKRVVPDSDISRAVEASVPVERRLVYKEREGERRVLHFFGFGILYKHRHIRPVYREKIGNRRVIHFFGLKFSYIKKRRP